MNRYEMEPILNPVGRFVIYGDHLSAVEKLEARIAELESKLARYEAVPTLDDCIHMDRLEAINKEQGANLRRYRAALEEIRDQSQDRADEAAGIARRALNP